MLIYQTIFAYNYTYSKMNIWNISNILNVAENNSDGCGETESKHSNKTMI